MGLSANSPFIVFDTGSKQTDLVTHLREQWDEINNDQSVHLKWVQAHTNKEDALTIGNAFADKVANERAELLATIVQSFKGIDFESRPNKKTQA